MSNKILIANSNTDESAKLQNHLCSQFDVSSIRSENECGGGVSAYELILADHNFSESNELGFLLGAAASSHIPLLLLCPPDDVNSAAEAMNDGAFNFVVKTGEYFNLLPLAIDEAIKRLEFLISMCNVLYGMLYVV